ncbi:putative short-chain dehydrogenase [Talaromyces proteolyticus]|uniref:Short-chain dehydrogenase n=1 Tax=Talaromyces proteolyticus TaxID=1131652 RepID=A0AAD4KHF1_9EURO|nr:putative short-chain dehydrogenase [Talaromyces proteolyticus]KAH8690499.1 putative short-chain dehydrogenase [Talaromyces proteolyticus]
MATIAVITGGAGDIGRAIASQLAVKHSLTVLVDINSTKLNQALDTFPSEIRQKMAIETCDVTDSTAVNKLAEKISALGSIKTLVNNAGATSAASLHETNPDSWRREISLNLDAAYLCFHAFADHLKKTIASVINISSANGLGTFGNPAYSTAKAGLIHFTRAIAVEYGKFGVRANAVAPGTVRTAAWDEKIRDNPAVFEEVIQWYPMGRAVEVEDVAAAVAFLSGDQAKAITGVCLPVDGGLLAGMPPVARSFGVSEYY